MGRTRSSKPEASDDEGETVPNSNAAKYSIAPRKNPASHMLVIPQAVTPDSRIVTLPHPRSGQPSRYLVCPKTGIHEFTTVAAPKSAPTSWLIEKGVKPETTDNGGSMASADIVAAGDMYVATKIDPVFLVLPALDEGRTEKGSDAKKRMFLSSDDHFDKLPEESSHLNEILRWDTTRKLIETRMESVCDTVDAGDEKMFRLSEQKLFSIIFSKAKRMSANGLPASMEEKFVKKALEAPVLLKKIVKRPAQVPAAPDGVDSEVSTPLTDSAASQSTTTTADSQASQPSTAATSFVEDEEDHLPETRPSPEVLDLQRLRVAFDFICGKYIPLSMATQLQVSLKGLDSGVDFAPLDAYMTRIAALRSEALAANATADYSRKRGRDEDEDEIRMEKKRKLEEEKKRKANESRGVRDLKKVNTSGMMKLSHFFKAK